MSAETHEPERIPEGPLGVLVFDYIDEPRLDIWAKASRDLGTLTLYQGGDVITFPAEAADSIVETLRALAGEALR